MEARASIATPRELCSHSSASVTTCVVKGTCDRKSRVRCLRVSGALLQDERNSDGHKQVGSHEEASAFGSYGEAIANQEPALVRGGCSRGRPWNPRDGGIGRCAPQPSGLRVHGYCQPWTGQRPFVAGAGQQHRLGDRCQRDCLGAMLGKDRRWSIRDPMLDGLSTIDSEQHILGESPAWMGCLEVSLRPELSSLT